jgi:hypothetical protein
MSWMIRIQSVMLTVAALAPVAAAQPPSPIDPWTHGTTINAFAGAGHDAANTSALLGGAFGWEITPAVGVEARGTWFDRGAATGAFGADLTLQAGLTRPQTIVPFVAAGLGFYRAWFDSGAQNVPGFYGRRMMAGPAGAFGPGGGARQSFTDPSFVVGAGVNWYVTRHVAIRPDVGATIVRHGGAGHTVTTFSVRLAYHFEPHPMF